VWTKKMTMCYPRRGWGGPWPPLPSPPASLPLVMPPSYLYSKFFTMNNIMFDLKDDDVGGEGDPGDEPKLITIALRV
jgi:hypothetical protein